MSLGDTFDWQNEDFIWGGQGGSFALADNLNSGPWDMQQFNRNAVVVSAVPTAAGGRWQMIVKGWDSSLKSFLRSSRTIIIGAGAAAHLLVPVSGEWVTWEIAGLSGTGAATLNGDISNNGPLHRGQRAFGDGVLVDVQGSSVAAGGNLVTNATEVAPGVATLSVSSTSANFYAAVDALNAAGAWERIAQVFPPAGQTGFVTRLDLPWRPVRLAVHNNDAAAQLFWGTIVPGV